MSRVIFLFFMVSFIFSEDIYYLPEDTFFNTLISKEDFVSSKKEYKFKYKRLDDSDSWGGYVGHMFLTLELDDKTITHIGEIVNQSTDKKFYIFFYDTTFSLQKHSFSENYNPNSWYWLRRYNSRHFYLSKEAAKKHNNVKELETLAKKKNLSKDDPLPLPVYLPKWSKQEIKRLGKSLLTKRMYEKLTEKQIRTILNAQIPIKLKKNSQYCIYMISYSNFHSFEKGNHAQIYKLDDTGYDTYNYRNKKWFLKSVTEK